MSRGREALPGWLPMATAPKDGTEIALLFATEETVLGKRVPRVRAASWCGDWSIPYYKANPPIAWQRMPAAPVENDGFDTLPDDYEVG